MDAGLRHRQFVDDHPILALVFLSATQTGLCSTIVLRLTFSPLIFAFLNPDYTRNRFREQHMCMPFIIKRRQRKTDMIGCKKHPAPCILFVSWPSEEAMLERLIEDTACDLGLPGSKIERLSSLLIALVCDRNGGGFSEFSAYFHTLGMQETFSSWSSSQLNQPIAFDEVKQVFGVPLIAAIGGKLGIGSVMTTRALCRLLPGVIEALTIENKASPMIPDLLRRRCAGTFEWLREMESAGWIAWRSQDLTRQDLDFPQPLQFFPDDMSRGRSRLKGALDLLAGLPFRA